MAVTKTAIDFNTIIAKHGTLEQCLIKGVKPGLYYNLPSTALLPRFSIPLKNGVEDVMYVPTLKQQAFHRSTAPNCILEGSRGTGKSVAERFDAHMRSLAHDGFVYLIIRRTMPELRQSHLKFISQEMEKLGGHYHNTNNIAYYPNGSLGFFGHCETTADILRHLGSQYGAIYFDEITTFPWSMVQQIASCIRVEDDSGLMGVLRGGTNPIGQGAAAVKRYFITKSVDPSIDSEYNPDEYEAIRTLPEDNPHLDRKQYASRLSSQPEHIRRAWLLGEWVDEGAYFSDFHPNSEDGQPWHVIQKLPSMPDGTSILGVSWIRIYRSLDWGFNPDPCVCLWTAMFPNGWEVTFKERHYRGVIAADVAKELKRESNGMLIAETFADPSMFMKHGESPFSVGELFENNGVPLTKSMNDRALWGYAIHDGLNTIIDQKPKTMILAKQNAYEGCPNLIRTLADMQMDPKDQTKIGPGEDHWVAALAYQRMGGAPPSRDPTQPLVPRWMLPNAAQRRHRYQRYMLE